MTLSADFDRLVATRGLAHVVLERCVPPTQDALKLHKTQDTPPLKTHPQHDTRKTLATHPQDTHTRHSPKISATGQQDTRKKHPTHLQDTPATRMQRDTQDTRKTHGRHMQDTRKTHARDTPCQDTGPQVGEPCCVCLVCVCCCLACVCVCVWLVCVLRVSCVCLACVLRVSCV